VFVDFSRDVKTFPGGAENYICGVSPALPLTGGIVDSNQIADYEEDLILYGLSVASPPSVLPGLTTHDIMMDLTQTAIIDRAQALLNPLGNAPILLSGTIPTSCSTPDMVMCVGGYEDIDGRGGTGIAEGDLRNLAYGDNNCRFDPATGNARGVYPSRMYEASACSSPDYPLMDLYAVSRNTGVPVGMALDVAVFSNPTVYVSGVMDCSPYLGTGGAVFQRCTVIQAAISEFGRLVGSTLAHEVAHSLGVVEEDQQPMGQFGNVCPWGGDIPINGGVCPNQCTIFQPNIGKHTNYPVNGMRCIMGTHPSYLERTDPLRAMDPISISYFERRLFY
jgi:hypothetical protein